METPDYYTILGIARNASQDDVKKAYRRLARKFHPDVSKQADADRRMAEVNEANDVLSDPAKRAVYDQIGHRAWSMGARSVDDVRPARGARSHGPTGPQGGEDFSDLFQDMFRRGRTRGAGSQSGPEGWPGQDIHAEIAVSLADAYAGTTRSLQLQSSRMDGQGRLIPEIRTLEVKIPAGVGQGQMIRLAGQGEPGFGTGKPGDLYLQVQIEAPERVQVEGRNVHMPLIVTPWEAALGADIPLRTPGGSVHVTLPAGSVARRKLRLRGRGIPGKTPGDIILEIEIAMPSAVTADQKAAWQALANTYPGFDPRPH